VKGKSASLGELARKMATSCAQRWIERRNSRSASASDYGDARGAAPLLLPFTFCLLPQADMIAALQTGVPHACLCNH
jgi:hypothetical protein